MSPETYPQQQKQQQQQQQQQTHATMLAMATSEPTSPYHHQPPSIATVADTTIVSTTTESQSPPHPHDIAQLEQLSLHPGLHEASMHPKEVMHRPSNNGPFSFTPDELMDLIDPKSPETLRIYGGVEGVLAGLFADPARGLMTATTLAHGSTGQPLDKVVTVSSMAMAYPEGGDGMMSEKKPVADGDDGYGHPDGSPPDTSAGFVDTVPAAAVTIGQREEYFGRNVLPKRKAKNIFQLMWIALQEKILILLLVAALVSIALGIYEDYGMKQEPTERFTKDYESYYATDPKISWVEGVAILVAVAIVVLVGSINDYQKEAQFRKLNAKKEDREVKVLRNGETVLISVFDIVVGDILHLEPGDVIAADGIFLGGHNLKCDESAMTGESDAVKKVTLVEMERLEAAEAALNERINSTAHQDNTNSDLGAKIETNHEGIEVIAEQHGLHGVDPFIISGSKVLEGVGLYVATGVGQNSFHGKTMMSLRTEPEDTPLQVKLNLLAERIAKLGSLAALLMLIILIIRYFVGFKTKGTPPSASIVQSLVNIVIAAVTVIVVAVPEGLPLAVTLALAFATTRMLKDNNLVRVLAACETMGNATTICSDKTGTLTQNRMTIVAGTLGIGTRFIADSPPGETNPRANIPINRHAVSMNQLTGILPPAMTKTLHEAIAINSSAFESEDDKGQISFIGSKTEVALLDFSKNIGGPDYRRLREQAPIVHLYPFSSERKSMATIVQMGPKKFRLHAKGASEIIMKRCDKILQITHDSHGSSAVAGSSSDSEKNSGGHLQSQLEDLPTLDLIGDLQIQVHKTIISYATQSLRTIGIAYRDFESWPPPGVELNSDGDVPFSAVAESELTMIGVVGIEDPLRDGVPEAVLSCQRAGVFVRMVTGDNILTAKSIATQCGIYTQGGLIMEGPKFRALSVDEMDAVIPRLQVLARSSPEDKKILVGRLKALGEIVAVTGDGTNDGPALKMSDVGFSMGIAGTEVAKEASSIILMDDNFSSIVKAILWGRTVNDAVKKFLQFQLTVNVTAVVLTLVTAVISEDQEPVMSAVQLLWVNLIMDTLAALALATDPPTMDLLDRQPEPRTAPLISFAMWKMILGEAILQLVITFVLKYAGMSILNYDEIPDYLNEKVAANPKVADAYFGFKRQELDTMVFNTFVFLQIFNEINCRRLDSHLNIFSGILRNRYFVVIFVIMVVFQIIIIEFGGAAFQTERLDGIQWLICVLLGLLSLPVGVIVRLIPDEIFGPLKNWIDRPTVMAGGTLPLASASVDGGYMGGAEFGRVSSISASVTSNRQGSIVGGMPESPRNSGMYSSREALVWNSAISKVQSELSVFKALRGGRLGTGNVGSKSLAGRHVMHAGAMVPSLVATSVGAGWVPRAPGSQSHNGSSSGIGGGIVDGAGSGISASPRSSIVGSRQNTARSK
ncbi:hypothetical protein BGW38_009920 [Lunasporangiospora selenospora]|uniref:Calcium-transporting ATPase 2 n=1 Tax=Lunasporangiospora selenospora TaxID=979761 RepID=A0A9P6FYV5_9FUNG|nr:hypothetical protein BGW38_009920 [Lunasporangiospora selenospora]